MKKIYSSPDYILLNHLKNILEINQIKSVIENMYLSSAFGILPSTEISPELWIFDDEKYEEAWQLIAEVIEERKTIKNPWQCPNCSEKIEGQFTSCWKCGTEKQ